MCLSSVLCFCFCFVFFDILAGVPQKSNSSSNGSQPSTPTSSSTNISLRTPRSVIPTRDNPPPELSDWLNQFKQWSHVERLVAVDRLIEHCEPTQVRHMMKGTNTFILKSKMQSKHFQFIYSLIIIIKNFNHQSSSLSFSVISYHCCPKSLPSKFYPI